MKPESGPHNASMYGSSFASQRTSLESISDRDYSVYGGISSNNSNSFISQDGLDFNVRKDHALPKTPISRSFSGYAQPPHSDAQKASRSFSGFATENMSASDHSTLIVPPKSGSFNQFLGFGAIGSAGQPNARLAGPGGHDSFSSESTESGIEHYNGHGGGHSMKAEGQGQRPNPYMNQGNANFMGSDSQEVLHRDQFGDVVRSMSRSSSFGSTLDSLSSYKHVGEDGDPHRRGGFVIRDQYGNNSSSSFQSHGSRSFDPMHNPRYGNITLHDVTESLEEDDDRRTCATGKDGLGADPSGTGQGQAGLADTNGNINSNSQPDGSVSTVDVNVTYGGAASIASSKSALAEGGNEQSNIDSFIGFPVNGGSAYNNSDNGSIKYNKDSINILSKDIITNNNASNSNTTHSGDQILFGGLDGVSPLGGDRDRDRAYPRGSEGVRNTLDLEVSAYEHGGENGGHFRSMTQGEMLGDSNEERRQDDEREDFSRRPSSALSEKTADYLQDDFTLLTTDTNAFIPLDKWMIKVWLHIAFSGFDCDIIEGFITKLRDDGGFVTVQVCICLCTYFYSKNTISV